MTDELTLAVHAHEQYRGAVTRRLAEIEALLIVASQALARGRTEVVNERLAAAVDDLRAIQRLP
jgi:pyrrolidone-carboxylate peptidase